MLRRIANSVFLACSAFTLASFHIDWKNRAQVKTIIVDAGHGGHDSGAPGAYSYEKDICLAISLKLGEKLREELPDTKIVLTRTTDVFDSPNAKANKANENNGNLFISIHCNSADPIRRREFSHNRTVTKYRYEGKGKRKKKIPYTVEEKVYVTRSYPNPAKGTETYIWGAHKNGTKEDAVAKKENAAIYNEVDYKKVYGDFDSKDFFLYAQLKTQQYFKRSYKLASLVQDEFQRIGRIDRDVRQRAVGIWVLQATSMPSVLVETGYISNPEEEKYLNSEEGQRELTASISNAVKKYKADLEAIKNSPVETGNGRNKENPDILSSIAAILRKEDEEVQAGSGV